jgi:hypothetical protein
MVLPKENAFYYAQGGNSKRKKEKNTVDARPFSSLETSSINQNACFFRLALLFALRVVYFASKFIGESCWKAELFQTTKVRQQAQPSTRSS